MSLWLLLQSLVMTAGQLARGHHFNMNGSNSYATEDATQRRDALVSRLFDATLGAWDILAVYIDDRLDFYRTLAERGSVTSPELATATGTHERYVREWLEQQASSRNPRRRRRRCDGKCPHLQPAARPRGSAPRRFEP